MKRYIKKMDKFFWSHPRWNSLAHILIGIGVGFILARPLATIHPVRWGIAFIVVGLLIHLKAMFE